MPISSACKACYKPASTVATQTLYRIEKNRATLTLNACADGAQLGTGGARAARVGAGANGCAGGQRRARFGAPRLQRRGYAGDGGRFHGVGARGRWLGQRAHARARGLHSSAAKCLAP